MSGNASISSSSYQEYDEYFESKWKKAFISLLLSGFLSNVSLGVIAMLGSRFFQLYPERIFLRWRILVLILLILNLTINLLQSTFIVKIFAMHFGDWDYPTHPSILSILPHFLSLPISTSSQLYLLHRSYKFFPLLPNPLPLYRRHFLIVMLSIFLIVFLSSCLIGALQFVKFFDHFSHPHLYPAVLKVWLGSSVALNLGIWVALTGQLRAGKKKVVVVRELETDVRGAVGKVNKVMGTIVRSGTAVMGIQVYTLIVWIIGDSHWKHSGHSGHSGNGRSLVGEEMLGIATVGLQMLPRIYTITLLLLLTSSRTSPPLSPNSKPRIPLYSPSVTPANGTVDDVRDPETIKFLPHSSRNHQAHGSRTIDLGLGVGVGRWETGELATRDFGPWNLESGSRHNISVPNQFITHLPIRVPPKLATPKDKITFIPNQKLMGVNEKSQDAELDEEARNEKSGGLDEEIDQRARRSSDSITSGGTFGRR